MEFVVDANILVAGFLRSARTRELLLDERLTLWSPEYGIRETERVLASVSVRRRLGGISQTMMKSLLNQLTARIRVLPARSYQHCLRDALHLTPHLDDAPYLALALHLHVPLWSNDIALKRQRTVSVYATHELIALLSSLP